MSASSRKKKSNKRKDDAHLNQSSQEKNLASFFSFLILSVFLMQYLIPTESLELGGRLWIPILWMGIGVGFFFFYARHFTDLLHWNRPGAWMDFSVLLLVSGHVLSSMYYLTQPANHRAVLNVMWEWVGLGMSWILIRIFFNSFSSYHQFRSLVIASVSSLALFGMYQHYYSFPASAREYEVLRTRLDQLEATPVPADPAAQQRYYRELNEAVSGLTLMGAPLQQPARRMWEDRLQGSTEPLGFFALANTFAGILVIGFFFSIQGFLEQYRRNQGGWLFVVLCLLILFCLILTKSRTAFVALLAGACLWGILSWKYFFGKVPTKKILVGLAGFFLLIAGFLAIAQLTRGFDREILSQAFKSFEYRLQYWKGTAEVLKESPFWGAGPGNFRQNYLEHKLPESSEEIGDPHNLFLDAWVNGGLISLMGLIGIVISFLYSLIKTFRNTPPEGLSSDRSKRTDYQKMEGQFSFSSLAGVFSIFLVTFFLVFLLDARIDMRILSVGVITAVLYSVISQKLMESDYSRTVVSTSLFSLSVHLLGAGGMEMPAVVGTLLILLNYSTVELEKSPEWKPSKNLLLASTTAVILLASYFTGMLPVTASTRSMEMGDLEIQQGNQYAQAEKLYHQASQDDSFSPIPHRRLSELYFQKWKNSQSDSLDLLDDSLREMEISIRKSPLDSQGYHLAGVRYRIRYEKSKSPEDLKQSREYLEKARERYPTENLILIDLVKTTQLSSDSEIKERSRQYAKEALELEDINRREGHADKYLSEENLNFLSQIN